MIGIPVKWMYFVYTVFFWAEGIFDGLREAQGLGRTGVLPVRRSVAAHSATKQGAKSTRPFKLVRVCR